MSWMPLLPRKNGDIDRKLEMWGRLSEVGVSWAAQDGVSAVFFGCCVISANPFF